MQCGYPATPWHFLYFLPLPQGQGSLRPTLGCVLRMGCGSDDACAPVASAAPPPDSMVGRGRRRACLAAICCATAAADPDSEEEATGAAVSSRRIWMWNSFWHRL